MPDTPDEDLPLMANSQWESVNTNRYDARWKAMADAGENPHGEADFVSRFDPASVLDAGCGTGRVGIELAQRGIDIVGVDLDGPMIETARSKAPALTWHQADLATLDLGQRFDVAVMAGNVIIFAAEGTQQSVVGRLAVHLEPGGLLVAGYQLGRGVSVANYDGWATAHGLVLTGRWSSWDGQPFEPDSSSYNVSVHQLRST